MCVFVVVIVGRSVSVQRYADVTGANDRLRGYHVFGRFVHFVGKVFGVQRIHLESDVIDFETERALVADARRH